MSGSPYEKKPPYVELAERYGFSDEQIEAMGGMAIMLSRSTIWRLRNKSPDSIRRKLEERYAPAIIAEIANFSAMSDEERISPDFKEKAINLLRNQIAADIKIARTIGDPVLQEQAQQEMEAYLDMFSKIGREEVLKRRKEIEEMSKGVYSKFNSSTSTPS